MSRGRIAFAYAVVYLVWGSTYLAIRAALVSLPALRMAGARFLIAGSILFGAAMLRGAKRPTARQWRDAGIIGALLLLFGNGGVVLAERTVPSGVAALLIATEPLAIVLLSWAGKAGARPSLRAVIGIALGLAGVVVLVSSHSGFGNARVDLRGAALVVCGSLTWAIGSLYAGRLPVKARMPSMQSSGAQMLAGGTWLMIASVLAGEHVDLHAVTPGAWAAFVYLILAGSIAAFSAYAWLVNVEPPQRVATYAFVNPIIAVFVGWLLADEPIGAGTIAAAVLIVGAVVLMILPAKKT